MPRVQTNQAVSNANAKPDTEETDITAKVHYDSYLFIFLIIYIGICGYYLPAGAWFRSYNQSCKKYRNLGTRLPEIYIGLADFQPNFGEDKFVQFTNHCCKYTLASPF